MGKTGPEVLTDINLRLFDSNFECSCGFLSGEGSTGLTPFVMIMLHLKVFIFDFWIYKKICPFRVVFVVVCAIG